MQDDSSDSSNSAPRTVPDRPETLTDTPETAVPSQPIVPEADPTIGLFDALQAAKDRTSSGASQKKRSEGNLYGTLDSKDAKGTKPDGSSDDASGAPSSTRTRIPPSVWLPVVLLVGLSALGYTLIRLMRATQSPPPVASNTTPPGEASPKPQVPSSAPPIRPKPPTGGMQGITGGPDLLTRSPPSHSRQRDLREEAQKRREEAEQRRRDEEERRRDEEERRRDEDERRLEDDRQRQFDSEDAAREGLDPSRGNDALSPTPLDATRQDWREENPLEADGNPEDSP